MPLVIFRRFLQSPAGKLRRTALIWSQPLSYTQLLVHYLVISTTIHRNTDRDTDVVKETTYFTVKQTCICNK